jgi:hypothetical protein
VKAGIQVKKNWVAVHLMRARQLILAGCVVLHRLFPQARDPFVRECQVTDSRGDEVAVFHRSGV